jgi:hypothetical protein
MDSSAHTKQRASSANSMSMLNRNVSKILAAGKPPRAPFEPYKKGQAMSPQGASLGVISKFKKKSQQF